MNWPVLFPHRRFLAQLDHAAIVGAIGEAEARTSGQIRVFVTRHCVGNAEKTLQTAQKKFIVLGMEKTAARNAVLLFVAPVSRTFALVGDEGIHAKLGEWEWESIVSEAAACFREGDFQKGIVTALARIGDHLAAHFPHEEGGTNELPDAVESDDAPLVIVPPKAVPRSFLPAFFLAAAGALVALRLLAPPAEETGRFLLCRGGLDCGPLFHAGWTAWLPLLGLGGYLLELGLLLGAYFAPPRTLFLFRLLKGLALVGAVLSLGLIAGQLLVLHGFCLLCGLSALCSVGLAVVLWGLPAATPEEAPRQTVLALAGCLALASVALAEYLPPLHLPAFSTKPPASLPAPVPIEIDLADAQLLGSPTAPVRLVVYSDFTCSYCARLAPVLAQVVRDYAGGGQVLFAYKDFPLPDHPLALASSRAGRCAAAQGLFWPYHDALYRLVAEGAEVLSEAQLFDAARAAGLDLVRFKADYQSGRMDASVRTSCEAARRLGIDGAPTLFLNGVCIGGTISSPELRLKIAEALKREGSVPPSSSSFDSAASAWR